MIPWIIVKEWPTDWEWLLGKSRGLRFSRTARKTNNTVSASYKNVNQLYNTGRYNPTLKTIYYQNYFDWILIIFNIVYKLQWLIEHTKTETKDFKRFLIPFRVKFIWLLITCESRFINFLIYHFDILFCGQPRRATILDHVKNIK